MKQLIACAVLAAIAGQAGAVVIDAPGSYIINSHVDQILVDSSLDKSQVSIHVVSGGRVANDVRCSSGSAEDCSFNLTVSGTGSVMGRARGADSSIEIRDGAYVYDAGAQFNGGGKVTVRDNARLGTLSGAGSGINGTWEINGGNIDSVASSANGVRMIMNAGTVNDSISGWGLSLDLTGGAILGDVQSNALGFSLRMDGGRVAGAINAYDEALRGYITGGAIDGNLTARGAGGGSFDIFGGQFGTGNANPLWWLGGSQVFNVHGRDLLLANGRLSGWLLDGSRLDVGINFGQGFNGAVNLYNVPEPGTLALLAVGLLGAFAARRKAQTAA